MTADNHDPFAFARCGADDTELFTVIEQWRLVDAETHRLYDEWVAQGMHDGSPSGQAYSAQWDAQYELRDKIEALRATTVQGVLALFEVAEAEGAEDEGIFHRCFEAGIASLREIGKREARS
jgi:hypothetical protein